MTRKRSAHLMRIIIEGSSGYSPYRGAQLAYQRDYDSNPMINVDLTSRIDVNRAIEILFKRGELSKQECLMLIYVMMDGRLSRRDISKIIEKEHGYFIDQRTISRRLETAYFKISKFLGFEYSDGRMFKMVARAKGHPDPYILNDEDIERTQQIWERV